MATRDELVAAMAERYARAGRAERGADPRRVRGGDRASTASTRCGCCGRGADRRSGPRPGRRVYDEAVREALIVLWEASDRVCGKRLRPLVPVLVEAMERHGHLAARAGGPDRPAGDERGDDRPGAARRCGSRRAARAPARTRPRRRSGGACRCGPSPTGAIRRRASSRRIWWRTAARSARGSFVQTLVLTDIATGWTECAPLLVREQALLVEVLGEVRKLLPFALLGFDTDNDSVFMNETVRDYCRRPGIEFTRCRPYRKNDQAWVEQKNGAVVRRIVGYRRFEGLEAAARAGPALRVGAAVRELLPALVQAGGEGSATGAQVTKRYHAPATPCSAAAGGPAGRRRRSPADRGAGSDARSGSAAARDPGGAAAAGGDRRPAGAAGRRPARRRRWRSSWPGCGRHGRSGEVRPTAQPKPVAKRLATPARPIAAVTAQLQGWFEAEPWRTVAGTAGAAAGGAAGQYPEGLLRTLQRRVKIGGRRRHTDWFLEPCPVLTRPNEMRQRVHTVRQRQAVREHYSLRQYGFSSRLSRYR